MDLTRTTPQKPSPAGFMKRLMNGLGMNVRSKFTVYNHTDATAYIILSETPVHHTTGVALDGVSVNRQMVGEYRDQRSYLAPGGSRKFKVFKQNIYYSIYFKLSDGRELVHTVDKLHDALKKDINILQRHVSEAQPGTIPSI